MDEVPFEIFSKIFSYLGLQDKTRCKRVSKQWKRKIELLNVRCLTITNSFKPFFHHFKWFDRDRFIDYQNHVLEANFESSFLRSTKPMLSGTKELILCHLKLSTITRALYIFSGQIERLILEGIKDCDTNNSLYISSPKLRMLSLADFSIEKVVLILPELRSLEFDNIAETTFEFHHASSIEHFESEYYECCSEEFENLKILKFDTVYEEEEGFSEHFLRNKPGIEELHFGDQSLFYELKRQRKEFGLTKLKLFYLGLDVTDATSLKQFDDCHEELNEARLKLYIENYSKMADKLPFETEIDFCEVEPIYSRLPAGFWKKLMYLDSIRVTKRINDESKFIECLEQLKVFGVLEVEVNCISQLLLKRISAINPFLLHLVLKSETAIGYSEEDLQTIIANFGFLTAMEFEFATSLEFVQNAFENRNFLIAFTFLYKDSNYRIDEICSEHDDFIDLSDAKEYRLYKDDSNIAFGSISELIDKIKKKKFGFLLF